MHMVSLIPISRLPMSANRCLLHNRAVFRGENGGSRGLGKREGTDAASLGQEMVVEGKKGAGDFAFVDASA
jgi:hypothetical protein